MLWTVWVLPDLWAPAAYKLSATPPRWILYCALSSEIPSSFPHHSPCWAALGDVSFSAQSDLGDPRVLSVPSLFAVRSPNPSIESPAVQMPRVPTQGSHLDHSVPTDLALDVQLSGGPGTFPEASSSSQ